MNDVAAIYVSREPARLRRRSPNVTPGPSRTRRLAAPPVRTKLFNRAGAAQHFPPGEERMTTEKKLETELKQLQDGRRAAQARVREAQARLDAELADHSPGEWHPDSPMTLLRPWPDHRREVARRALEVEERRVPQLDAEIRDLESRIAAVRRGRAQVAEFDEVVSALAETDRAMTAIAIELTQRLVEMQAKQAERFAALGPLLERLPADVRMAVEIPRLAWSPRAADVAAEQLPRVLRLRAS